MNIVLLGSGNVATHLGKALQSAGHTILQVFSRTFTNAEELAQCLRSDAIDNLKQLNPQADIYIVSVSDDAIEQVLAEFPFGDKILVHTSGSTALDIPGISGVIYPLQTFSKQTDVVFANIPIAIEGKDQQVTQTLIKLAHSISSNVTELNSEQRKALHIAAVFACNFTNHLYSIAEGLLNGNKLDFDLIRPLIKETADKIQQHSPSDVQTGPAIRNDQLIINKHIQYLENNKELKEIYQKLSQGIINFNQKV